MRQPPEWLWYFLLATVFGAIAHFPKWPDTQFGLMMRFMLYLTSLWFALAGTFGLADHISLLVATAIERRQYALIAGERELLRMVQAVGESMRGLNPSVAVVLAQHLIEVEDNTWMLKWLDEISPNPNSENCLEYPVIRDYPEGSREYNELMALSDFLVGKGLMYRRPGRTHLIKSPEALSMAYKYATRGKQDD